MDTEQLLRVHRCDCAFPGPRPTNALRSPGAICYRLCQLGGTAHPNPPAYPRHDAESQLGFPRSCPAPTATRREDFIP